MPIFLPKAFSLAQQKHKSEFGKKIGQLNYILLDSSPITSKQNSLAQTTEPLKAIYKPSAALTKSLMTVLMRSLSL